MRRWPLRVIVGATLFFLYFPLITLMVFSFNDSRRNIVWQGFTLKYYEKAFNNASLIEAFTNSLTIAFFCTIISVVLGALAAVMLWRFRFPGKTARRRRRWRCRSWCRKSAWAWPCWCFSPA